MIDNFPPSNTNQAQPEPKRVVAAAANSSLNLSKLPKVASIASLTSPVGTPPAFGAKISQKKVWFTCPPPLFLTAVRISSGIASKLLISSSIVLLPNSGCFSIAAFRLVT